MNSNIAYRKPIETKNVRAVKNAVRTAVNNNRMIAVIAEIGSGKTTLFNYLADFWQQHPNRFKVVTVKGFDMKASRVSAIMKLLIEKINPDAHIPIQIERIYDVLTHELRTFCAKEENRVILMIDEAQDLNTKTFRDLKKLHEISGNGRDHLLSVILFGKPHRKWDLLYAGPELGFRMQDVILESLSSDELVQIAEERFALRFDSKKVRDRFVASMAYKTPLGVEHFALALRKEIGADDEDSVLVTSDLVTKIPMLTYKFRFKQAGITQSDFADFASKVLGRKVSRQRVNEFNNGKLNEAGLNNDLMLAAEEMLKQHAQQKRRLAVGE
jgi:energy-coupling factor transporter ATP-binding protein EcfA2